MGKIIKAIKNQIQIKYKETDIKDQYIKDQLWLFLSSVIENPSFNSQTKDELITPVNKFGSTCELSKGFLKKIFDKLKIDEIVLEHIKLMENIVLSKLNIKKKVVIKGIKKARAGTMLIVSSNKPKKREPSIPPNIPIPSSCA